MGWMEWEEDEEEEQQQQQQKECEAHGGHGHVTPGHVVVSPLTPHPSLLPPTDTSATLPIHIHTLLDTLAAAS